MLEGPDHSIETRADLVAFLDRLAVKARESPELYEPATVADLLERMAHYASTPLAGFLSNLRPDEDVETASWQRFADIVGGAMVYE